MTELVYPDDYVDGPPYKVCGCGRVFQVVHTVTSDTDEFGQPLIGDDGEPTERTYTDWDEAATDAEFQQHQPECTHVPVPPLVPEVQFDPVLLQQLLQQLEAQSRTSRG